MFQRENGEQRHAKRTSIGFIRADRVATGIDAAITFAIFNTLRPASETATALQEIRDKFSRARARTHLRRSDLNSAIVATRFVIHHHYLGFIMALSHDSRGTDAVK